MNLKNFFVDLKDGLLSTFKGKPTNDNLISLDGRVALKSALPFALEHILAMFAANITPIIITFSACGITGALSTYALLAALFMAGLSTIIQLLLGARLPIVAGTSFTFVPILINIGLKAGGGEDAYYTIMASIIVGGLVSSFLALFYKYWGKIIKPIVPAIVVLAVGLSLLSSGANQFLGGTAIISNVILTGETGTGVSYYLYIIVAFVTIIVTITWGLIFKGFLKNINIIVGIIVGYLVALAIPGMIDFSSLKIDIGNLVGPSGIFAFPQFLDFSKLKFDVSSCVLTSVVFIVSMVEVIGGTTASSEVGLNRMPTSREFGGAIFTNSLLSTFGALFGTLPLTTYAQNTGIVAQSKVINRFTIFIGGLLLVIISFFPPIANFFYTIPDAVIGGTMVILFGSIVVVGIKSVGEAGFSDKNVLILTISLSLGFGLSIATIAVGSDTYQTIGLFKTLGVSWLSDLLSSSVFNMFIVSLILSWALPDNMYIKFIHHKNNKNDNE